MDLNQIELNTTIKELEFLRTDLEFKKLKIEKEDSNFTKMVKEVLKENPKLEELFNKKEEEFLESIKNNTSNNDDNDNDDNDNENSETGLVKSEIDNNTKNNNDNNDNDDNDDKKHENIIDVEENIEKDQKSKEIKNLYRLIVKKTHPDIINNKFKNNLYIEATDYYNDNDIYGIWDICNKLDIDFNVDYKHITEIKNSIIELRNKINFLEKTFTWQWSKAKNKKQKKNIIIQFINLKLNGC